jgi:hypothetical protein
LSVTHNERPNAVNDKQMEREEEEEEEERGGRVK